MNQKTSQHKSTEIRFSSYFLLALIAIPNPAWAYLDPGSVSLWLQGVLAAFAAVGATYRLWWDRIKSFFSMHSDNSSKQITSAERNDNP